MPQTSQKKAPLLSKTKLWRLISELDTYTTNRFARFVDSPWANKNETAIRLHSILQEIQQRDQVQAITFSAIHNSLWPSQPYSEQQLRYAFTHLTQLLEDFLAFNELRNQPIQKKRLLLQALKNFKLDHYFQQHLAEAHKLQLAQIPRDVQWFEQQIHLTEATFQHSAKQAGRATDDSLQQLHQHLDTWYLAKKLKFACEAINRGQVLAVQTDVSILDDLLPRLRANPPEEPAVTAYLLVLLSLQEADNESHYRDLIQLLASHRQNFPGNELRDIYVFAQNYCIRQINLGNTSYLRELYENYRVLLHEGVMLENGTLPQFHFKNIVTAGLRLGEYDWVETFIHSYKSTLAPELRDNAECYNLAWLHFSRKDYRSARKLLLAVEFTDVYYHLDSKALLLKTYFELNEFESLLSLISTFGVYLRRNRKISDTQRTTYANFVKLAKKLTQAKMGNRKAGKAAAEALQGTKQVADLNWLQGKLSEMEN